MILRIFTHGPSKPPRSDRVAAHTAAVLPVQRGQAIVEFAMVMPILILLLLGIIFFAMAFNLQMALNAAAREGARAWGSYRSGTSPCKGPDNVFEDHTCEPNDPDSGFQQHIVPLVRKYMNDNGYDGEKVVFEKVQVTKKEMLPQDWNALTDSAEDATKVKLIITYGLNLPLGGTNLITLKAAYTFKRGS